MVLLGAVVAEGLLFAIGRTFPKRIAAQKRTDNAMRSSQGRAINNNNEHRKMNDDQSLSYIFAELRISITITMTEHS